MGQSSIHINSRQHCHSALYDAAQHGPGIYGRTRSRGVLILRPTLLLYPDLVLFVPQFLQL